MNDSRVPSLLHDLVHHAERVQEMYVQAGEQILVDSRVQDAILWNFVVMGEMSARLGDSFHEQHPQIPWRAVIDHRNLIAHGYDVINWDRLAEVIRRDIPNLIEAARTLMRSFGPPPQA
ncbi:DUF86 domain-containing protein [Roseiflexus sp. AH-315-K22]|nr:DUF86 domain-containing protein [Roseiflexus sp. AH-315-K22]